MATETLPPAPPIRLPVFYALPLFIAALAYVGDMAFGNGFVSIGAKSIDRFAVITIVACAIEGILAAFYLTRRRYTGAALLLCAYLVVVAGVVLYFGTAVRH
jgi:hypothetical protein